MLVTCCNTRSCLSKKISGGTLAKLVYFEPTDPKQLKQRSPEDQEVSLNHNLNFFKPKLKQKLLFC